MPAIDFSFPDITNEIPNLSSRALSKAERRFYLNQSAITIFKQSPMGPVPVSIEGEKFLFTLDNNQDILKLATFYSVAVGQGNCYSKGLFGPLPVLNSEFRCLLFANMVKDPEQKDPRANEQTYLVTCFFYHSALEQRISKKREWVEQIFLNFFQARNQIDDVMKDLSLLKKSILCFLW
ncbi:MAG: hypothetical protein ACXAEU_13930 [Candidatus Hodarchaeales archaeon]|jgi:hypothetical protein